ncbi:MAG: 6,7-dimethyl-8-ribityllumazine synthase [Rhodovarius sp.]|nr:6,7-dimethyl-8-ribityllumazine synthase [Rhodovarius sp.]MCX7931426.1 6,7-dimethyl-8-ribityllumazine synthase [Rhodovarius sp.]MDW8315041.1 6,7-dimethyl-8-ribityllumazine synthase [Rhodovarius sp.]
MSTADAPDRPLPLIPGPAPRLLCIQAPYYAQILAGMLAGARELADQAGAALEVVDVAGAFELPAALRMAIEANGEGPARRWDGFLILGCVVKGETDHYDHICREACSGVMAIAAATGLPVGFGLLTVHSLAQAEARAAPGPGNKGREAMFALLSQLALRRRWGLA